LFQDVVAIIQRHMAGDAKVEESAMLVTRDGDERQVDVVVRARPGGHEVLVAVEATSGRRKASVEWVEQMSGKHRELPTNKLVLVAEAGFTQGARKRANALGISALAPEDMPSGEDETGVLNELRSLWPKVVTLKPDRIVAHVRLPNGELQAVRTLPDNVIYLDDGRLFANPLPVAMTLIHKHIDDFEQEIGLGARATDFDGWFQTDFAMPVVTEGGVRHRLGLQPESETGLHLIERLEVTGKALIEVGEVELHHAKLGEVRFAHGETQLGGRPALVVVTEDAGAPKFSIRLGKVKPAAKRKTPGRKRP
jgi:hypothetical protein